MNRPSTTAYNICFAKMFRARVFKELKTPTTVTDRQRGTRVGRYVAPAVTNSVFAGEFRRAYGVYGTRAAAWLRVSPHN